VNAFFLEKFVICFICYCKKYPVVIQKAKDGCVVVGDVNSREIAFPG